MLSASQLKPLRATVLGIGIGWGMQGVMECGEKKPSPRVFFVKISLKHC